MPPQRSVVEMKFLPDEYLCTWHIPAVDGSTLHLPGSIELRSDRPPYGTVYGKVPLESDSADGTTSFSFPQIKEYPALRLTLANGGVGLILEAQINLMISQGSVHGAAAIMARAGSFMPWQEHTTEAATAAETFLFDSAEFQVSGLDSVLGVTPIGQKTQPTKKDGEGKYTWTTETNPKSEVDWTSEAGHTLSGWYSGKVNTFDFYNVSIRFAPLLRLKLAEGASLFDVVTHWLEPVRGIASIATGQSQSITYFAVGPAEGENQEATSQVFGTALKQAPYESNDEQVRRDNSALRCIEDGVNFLDLVTTWQKLKAEQHPLIETYAGMLHAKDSHPRSQFLLLMQSLEGMHGHDTQAEFAERCDKHASKRDELIAAVDGHISGKQKQFLKRNLQRQPARNLEDALNAAFDLPGEFDATRAALEGSHLVTKLVADEECTPLGALRIARNGLAHGTRKFPLEDLQQVNEILDRLVRAHGLRLLGCPDAVLVRLSQPAGH